MNLFENQTIEISPLDEGVKSDYAITIQIPPFKKVNHKGIYKQYSHFSENIQKELIQDYFKTSLGDILSNELYFERHQDGRFHMHTYLKSITYDDIYKVQHFFCADILKIRPKQFQQVFNFFKPDNFHYWAMYCQKERLQDLDADLAELNKV